MAKRGKKYNDVAKLIDRTKKYSVAEAVALVKKTAIAKFDSTIDVSFKLHLDTNNLINSSVELLFCLMEMVRPRKSWL